MISVNQHMIDHLPGAGDIQRFVLKTALLC